MKSPVGNKKLKNERTCVVCKKKFSGVHGAFTPFCSDDCGEEHQRRAEERERRERERGMKRVMDAYDAWVGLDNPSSCSSNVSDELDALDRLSKAVDALREAIR